MALARSWSDVGSAHIQAFTFLLTKTLKITVGYLVCGVVCVWNVVFCVCACGVCGVWVVCVHVVLCRCVLCGCVVVLVLAFGRGGVVCCAGGECVCVLSFFSLFLSSLFFRSSLFSLLSSLPLPLLSSRHQTLWKEPINQHGGQLRGIWMWSGARQVHSNRFSPSFSPLPPPFSPSPPQKKKKKELLITRRFQPRIYFYYSFKLVLKNRRRVKLQALQFYINSKTIGL